MLKSNMAKQIAGGLAGMAVAALVYVAVDQLSYTRIRGLLVSTNNVSENAGQVRTNSANMDEESIRRLEGRARAVADQLQSSAAAMNSSAIAETPLSNNVAERKQQRIFAHEVSDALSTAPTYTNDPNTMLTNEQRLAIRNARYSAADPAPTAPATTKTTEVAGIKGGYPVYIPQPVIERVEVEVPVEKTVIKEVIKEVPVENTVVKEVIKEVPKEVIREVIKEVPKEVIKTVVKEVPVYVNQPVPLKGGLPDSGPGLFLLTAGAAGAAWNRVYRKRKASR